LIERSFVIDQYHFATRRLDLGNGVLTADEIDEVQSTGLSEGDYSATDT
jgi:hypothetical protein